MTPPSSAYESQPITTPQWSLTHSCYCSRIHTMNSIINMDKLNINEQISQQIHNFESTSSTTIDELPDDCLIRIFKALDIPHKLRAEQVCKRWYKVSQRGWPDVKSLCLKDKYPNCNISQATKLLRTCGRLLTSLRIPVDYERSIYLKLLQTHCRQLRKLELIFDYWAFRPVLQCHARNLSQLFPTLGKLNCLVMEEINSNVVDKHLRALPGRLESLQISGTHGEWMEVPFSANISRFQNLRVLSLMYLVIKKESLRGFEQLEHLTELNLSFSDVPDECIRQIQTIEKLETLELRQRTISGLDPMKIRDQHICDIVQGCKKLRDLRLDGCERLTDFAFRNILTLKNLKILHMENLPMVTNRAIVNLHQVENLNCSHCPGIDNEGLKLLIQDSPNLIDLKARWTAEMPTFLQDVSEVMQHRKKDSVLTIDVGNGENPWLRPENFPDSIILV